jgi:hypothetical protein
LQLDFRHLLQQLRIPRFDSQCPLKVTTGLIQLTGTLGDHRLSRQLFDRRILQRIDLHTRTVVTCRRPDTGVDFIIFNLYRWLTGACSEQ